MGIKIPRMVVERRGEMKPTFGTGWKGGKREGGMGQRNIEGSEEVEGGGARSTHVMGLLDHPTL
jgi:hypothetical protein